jgi:hypothetical protein
MIMKKNIAVVLGGVLITAVVVVVPLIQIWVLNTLFNVGVGYTFQTWLASLLLGMLITGTRVAKK